MGDVPVRLAHRDGPVARTAHHDTFEDGLAATIDWFRANEAWWRAAKSGDWDAYYERQYGSRLAAGRAAAQPAGAIARDPAAGDRAIARDPAG